MEKDEPKQPKHYYVSMIRGRKVSLLAGPFATHAEALDKVTPARALAVEHDPRAYFDAFGTCSLDNNDRQGVFNAQL